MDDLRTETQTEERNLKTLPNLYLGGYPMQGRRASGGLL